jgi:heme exporter protein C
MHRYANPTRFLKLSGAVLPWTAALAVGLFAVGLWLALVASPDDYQQGATVRIMYIHVPSAWMAMFCYASMAVASVVALVWRHPLAELYTKAVAPVGAGFTAVCLVTGSLWGAPMWGTWWVWDARLTSVLILFFLYLGYLALVNAFDDPARGLKAGSILVLVGSVNLPVIKWSVDWWNTLHQPASISSIERIGTPAIDPSMMAPLLVMSAAFTAYFAWLALMRTRAEIQERKIQTLRLAMTRG